MAASIRHHAAERWAHCVVTAVSCEHDPRTLLLWARCSGASVGALKTWCRAANESPRHSLDFCRMLRAVYLPSDDTWDLFNLLDIVDARTLRRFTARCGLTSTERRPTVNAFLESQTLIRRKDNIAMVRLLLNEKRPLRDRPVGPCGVDVASEGNRIEGTQLRTAIRD
jgi:hypothetical protein